MFLSFHLYFMWFNLSLGLLGIGTSCDSCITKHIACQEPIYLLPRWFFYELLVNVVLTPIFSWFILLFSLKGNRFMMCILKRGLIVVRGHAFVVAFSSNGKSKNKNVIMNLKCCFMVTSLSLSSINLLWYAVMPFSNCLVKTCYDGRQRDAPKVHICWTLIQG